MRKKATIANQWLPLPFDIYISQVLQERNSRLLPCADRRLDRRHALLFFDFQPRVGDRHLVRLVQDQQHCDVRQAHKRHHFGKDKLKIQCDLHKSRCDQLKEGTFPAPRNQGGGIIKHHICNANLMRNGTDLAVYVNTAQEFDGSDAGAR